MCPNVGLVSYVQCVICTISFICYNVWLSGNIVFASTVVCLKMICYLLECMFCRVLIFCASLFLQLPNPSRLDSGADVIGQSSLLPRFSIQVKLLCFFSTKRTLQSSFALWIKSHQVAVLPFKTFPNFVFAVLDVALFLLANHALDW